ncbi:transcription initiation factor TFIID subunit 11-like [Planococcus citri]|uniref:transcription initiation factor TFIID subunit 11-like n=1 Tax=Planococcus citri TaxID=170843 RepID=UPI0031FA3D7C
MSPRKSRTAAIQASKALQSSKKQPTPTRAKKKPEPKKKQTEKSPKALKNKKKTEPAVVTKSNTSKQTTSENTPENDSPTKSNIKRRKVIHQDRLLNVINQIGGTVGEIGVTVEKDGNNTSELDQNATETETTEMEEIPLSEAVQNQVDEENRTDTEVSEQRTIYSCKFCNKDFSSAFVLFLHIRIHEKVGSITEPAAEAEPAQPAEQEEYDSEEDSDDEPQIKEEVIEEITIPDADDEDEAQTEVDPLQVNDPPKTEFVGIINKNFVENLKKNLSLAMNRQIN